MKGRGMQYCKCSELCGGEARNRHRIHPDWVAVGMPATFYINGDALPGFVSNLTYDHKIAPNGVRYGRKVRLVWAEIVGYKTPRKFKVTDDSVYGTRMSSLGGHGELVVGHSFYFHSNPGPGQDLRRTSSGINKKSLPELPSKFLLF